jgi:hypothetical protein
MHNFLIGLLADGADRLSLAVVPLIGRHAELIQNLSSSLAPAVAAPSPVAP